MQRFVPSQSPAGRNDAGANLANDRRAAGVRYGQAIKKPLVGAF
jgi:hypothetical protein